MKVALAVAHLLLIWFGYIQYETPELNTYKFNCKPRIQTSAVVANQQVDGKLSLKEALKTISSCSASVLVSAASGGR